MVVNVARFTEFNAQNDKHMQSKNSQPQHFGVIGGSAGAAARLGLKRTTLLSKMQRLDIHRP